MELNIFIKELEKALIERGIAEATAKKHVVQLCKSFTPGDLDEIKEIAGQKEINDLAESISAIIHKDEEAKHNSDTAAPREPHNTNKPEGNPAAAPTSKPRQSSPVQLKRPSPEAQPPQTPKASGSDRRRPDTYEDDEYTEAKEFLGFGDDNAFVDMYLERGDRGPTIFWLAFGLTLPITAIILLGIVGLFVGTIIALIGAILLGVAALVLVSALGTCVSLVGIIYGVTQLFSFAAAGIYEIGLGVVVAGISIFTAVAIYNIAVRLIPWIIAKVVVFMKFTFRKLLDLFYYLRRECYKL